MSRILRSRPLRNILLLTAIGLIAVFLLTNPQQAADAAKSGLSLCANVIVPSMFPFFVLSSLLVNLGMVHYLDRLFAPVMKPLFGLSGACSAALALGMIGGYPIGAKTALSLYTSHQISKTEAERLLAFCNNCGPAFLFGVVGAGIFSSSKIGLLLYLVHILVSLLIGLLFHLFGRPLHVSFTRTQRQTAPAMRFPLAFTTAVRDGLNSTLNICAFIVCFTVLIRFLFFSSAMDIFCASLAALLRPLGIGQQSIETILIGIIELSSGVWGLKEAAMSVSSRVVMAAFILGWAGLCVHCQVLSFTGETTLSIHSYLLGKFLHGVLSAGVVWLVYQILPISQSAASCYISQVDNICSLDFTAALRHSTITAALVWGSVCIICLYCMKKSSGNRLHNRV